jgi:hypothetical protein
MHYKRTDGLRSTLQFTDYDIPVNGICSPGC